MQVELVRTLTADGVRLDGVFLPTSEPPTCQIDSAILLHGVGGNFYSSRLFDIISQRGVADGVSILRVNTRGHDSLTVAETTMGGRRIGAAMELVSDCVADILGWVEFLKSRGKQRIALIGHSLGAIKAVYQQAHRECDSIAAVVAVSPPKLSQSTFLESPQAGDYRQELARAQAMVDERLGQELLAVRVPFPMVLSAQTYTDKYGGDRYDITQFVDRLQVPTLFVYGGQELATSGPTFSGVPEQLLARQRVGQDLSIITVDGADHNYRKCEEQLSAEVFSWLRLTFSNSAE